MKNQNWLIAILMTFGCIVVCVSEYNKNDLDWADVVLALAFFGVFGVLLRDWMVGLDSVDVSTPPDILIVADFEELESICPDPANGTVASLTDHNMLVKYKGNKWTVVHDSFIERYAEMNP
jgi:hypothetical protein